MASVWQQSVLPRFGRLENEITAGTLVIGGGMAGILTAYMLSRAGADCVLVEADRLCGGVTQNTTAKITSQHGLIYDKLIRRFGTDGARLYLEANESAINMLRVLGRGIGCDFRDTDSYVYSLGATEKLRAEASALKRLGYKAELTGKTRLPFPVAGALRFSGQAQFDPLAFAAGIVGGLKIYENTRVTEIRGSTAICERGRVRAKNIVVATHFPFINKHGSYFLKLYQQRSYVIALGGAPDIDGMYIDEAEGGMSFRNYGDMLLVGGGSHRTGKKSSGWSGLNDFAKRYYPGLPVRYRWATQDCMSLDGVPYVGLYSKSTPNLYVATGFNKWGMTSSMAAAMLLTDLITGKKNAAEPLFSPSRSIMRPQLAVNAFESVTNLLSPGKRRCPHLGCALKWNAQEHSWDCPCHGSRFAQDGTLLNNPATGDIEIKN